MKPNAQRKGTTPRTAPAPPQESNPAARTESPVAPVIIAVIVVAVAALLVYALRPKPTETGAQPGATVPPGATPHADPGPVAATPGSAPTTNQARSGAGADQPSAAPQTLTTTPNEIVEALRMQLARKTRLAQSPADDGAGTNWLAAQPLPTYEAEMLARRIPDDAHVYALALRAIAGRRFNEARGFLDQWFAENADPTPQQQAVMTVARADADYYGGDFASAARHYSDALAFDDQQAEVRYALACALMRTPDAERSGKLEEAIALLDDLLTGPWARDRSAEGWADANEALGIAWWSAASGDRHANRLKAIGCFEAAAAARPVSTFPADWAKMHNNLGAAWAQLEAGDRDVNLRKSIEAYNKAIVVVGAEESPELWLMLHHNKAKSLASLPGGDRNENLQQAIDALESGLTVNEANVTPYSLAAAQGNLGKYYSQLTAGNRALHLRRAVEVLEAALTRLDRAAHPYDWAMTQNNLGIVHLSMTDGDREASLKGGIRRLEAALEVFDRARFPAEWASTHVNLASAYHALPTAPRAKNLEQAIEHYQAALQVFTAETEPTHHAQITALLGRARGDLAAAGGASP